jgi:hypothetical protein
LLNQSESKSVLSGAILLVQVLLVVVQVEGGARHSLCLQISNTPQSQTPDTIQSSSQAHGNEPIESMCSN